LGEAEAHQVIYVMVITQALGAGLVLAGGALILYWYLYYKRNFKGTLLTGGPYGWVRHPFYTGFIILVVGLTLFLPIYETRLLLVFTLAVMYVHVPREEEQLLKQYKRKYAEYMKKVRWRLIPYIY